MHPPTHHEGDGHNIIGFCYGNEGQGLSLVLASHEVSTGINGGVNKTPGCIVAATDRSTPLAWAMSGWQGRRRGAGIINNKKWTHRVRWFCRKLRFPLPKNRNDTPFRIPRPQDKGRWLASHVEKHLGLWIFSKLTSAHGLTLLEGLQGKLRRVLPKEKRQFYLYLGHKPCRSCLNFLDLFRKRAGLTITPVSRPVFLREERKRIRRRHVQKGDQINKETRHEDEPELEPASSVWGDVEDTCPAARALPRPTPITSDEAPTSPYVPSHHHPFSSPASPTSTRTQLGKGSPPAGWKNGKPYPATPCNAALGFSPVQGSTDEDGSAAQPNVSYYFETPQHIRPKTTAPSADRPSYQAPRGGRLSDYVSAVAAQRRPASVETATSYGPFRPAHHASVYVDRARQGGHGNTEKKTERRAAQPFMPASHSSHPVDQGYDHNREHSHGYDYDRPHDHGDGDNASRASSDIPSRKAQPTRPFPDLTQFRYGLPPYQRRT